MPLSVNLAGASKPFEHQSAASAVAEKANKATMVMSFRMPIFTQLFRMPIFTHLFQRASRLMRAKSEGLRLCSLVTCNPGVKCLTPFFPVLRRQGLILGFLHFLFQGFFIVPPIFQHP